MFERFKPEAREVLMLAQAEARTLHQQHLGTEHLLLGLLAGTGPAATVLVDAGVTEAPVREEITRVVAGRLGNRGADALRTIGIDLDAVRARVEESFGPGALERAQVCDSKGRKRVRSWIGHIPLTPRAKKVLELSLRETLGLGHEAIGPEHILLGLIREGGGPAIQIVTDRGVSLDDLRRRVLATIDTAA